MVADDPRLPLPFTLADAVGAGLTARQAERRATKSWDRLRRGWYTAEPLTTEVRWRALVLAAVRAHERELVLSHASAARARALPRPLGGWGDVTVTTRRPPARRRGGVHTYVATLADEDVVSLGRVRATSVPRTLVDCARTLPPRDALALLDAALHRRY